MLKRLRFPLFCVETFSSLPTCQSNGRDFARQRQTSHLRLHALGQQSRVEIVEGSPPAAGPGGRTLEDLFHLMVVVLIETTELLGLLGAFQLSTNKAELRTVVRLNPQATIGPQLSLASEPVRGLHPRDQVGCSNRTDAGGAAASLPYVSGSRPKTRVAGFAARPVIKKLREEIAET